MNRAYFSCLMLLAVSAVTGCSAKEVKPPLAQSDTGAPYQLQIKDEVFDGKKLFIKSVVNQFSSEVVPPTVIRLKTVKNGESVGEAFLPFNESKKGQELQLSADAEDFTDYQVDLLWGKDAEAFLKSIPASKFVLLKDVTLVTDVQGSRITGSIENTGLYPISNVPLAVEFQWVKKGEYLDISSHDPDSVTDITVDNITIAPSETRPFSIALETELPKPEGQEGSWQVLVAAK